MGIFSPLFQLSFKINRVQVSDEAKICVMGFRIKIYEDSNVLEYLQQVLCMDYSETRLNLSTTVTRIQF